MISGMFALAFAAAFTGASFYVNWVEQPARLKLDDAGVAQRMGAERQPRRRASRRSRAACGDCRASSPISRRRTCAGRSARVVIIASWLYAFFVMSPLDNQIRSLRGGEVAAARALVRQWGIVESGLTANRRASRSLDVSVGALSGVSWVRARVAARVATSPRACAFSPACRCGEPIPARRSTLTASPGRRRSPASRSALIGALALGARHAARPAAAAFARGSRPRRSSLRPARCTRTGSPTSPTVSAAARRARGSSRSCATAASAPMARSRSRSRSSCASARWPRRSTAGSGARRSSLIAGRRALPRAALTPLALSAASARRRRWRRGRPARLERARRRLGLGSRHRASRSASSRLASPMRSWRRS